MKTLIAGLAGSAALLALAAPAAAQQIPPVADVKAATACAPADIAAAVDCLEKHLKPEVKDAIAKSANPEALMPQEIYVGLWMRNNWGFWTGSPIAQYMLAKRVTQPDAQTNRIVQAVWLKSKGCRYDWNNIGFIVAGIAKANRSTDPCSVTVAEATTAGRSPMGGAAPARAARAGAAPAAAGRGPAPASANVNADEEGED